MNANILTLNRILRTRLLYFSTLAFGGRYILESGSLNANRVVAMGDIWRLRQTIVHKSSARAVELHSTNSTFSRVAMLMFMGIMFMTDLAACASLSSQSHLVL